MRIIPTFPPESLSQAQPMKTLAYFIAFVLFLCVLGPLLVYPGVVLLLPACLLTVLVSVGLIGFGLCAAACVCYAFLTGGWMPGLCLLIALAPALFAGGFCIRKEIPFTTALLASFGALLTGTLCAILLALLFTEGQLSAVLAERLESWLRTSERTDTLLLYGYISGFLPLTHSISVPALALPAGTGLSIGTRFMGSSVVLHPEAREELLRALVFRFESGYCRDVPGQLLSGSVLGAALLQALPRRALRRRGCPVELPELRQWYIPAGKGRYVIAPMVIAWFLLQCSSGTALEMTYTSGAYIMFSAFYAACIRVFSLQGLALLDALLFQGGRSRGARTAFVVAGFVLLVSLAAFFGMADQYFDFRHLRRSPEDDNHDDDEQEDDF